MVMIKLFAMFKLLLMGFPVSAAEWCCLDTSLQQFSVESFLISGIIRQQALTAWSLIGAYSPAYEAALAWQHTLACLLNT